MDLSPPHLDRPFDYLVPPEWDQSAVPGARVKVRLAGRRLNGVILERRDSSDHTGKLTALAAVVSPEPVLAPEVLELATAVAQRWAGSLSDVLRLALPPRHARVEAEPAGEPVAVPLPSEAGSWTRYDGGHGFITALTQGGQPRAVWAALPGPEWPEEVALAAQACLSTGRGVLVIAPDQRDVDRIDTALTAALGAGRHVSLSAGLGPAARYRRFLALRRGQVKAVVGTRAAVFAPVQDLGLVICWDDGDDVLAEPRAPYPHARDVLILRAHQAGAAALIGGHAVTVEAADLVERGWAHPLAGTRETVRATAPRVAAASEEGRRLPRTMFDLVRNASGPVLVQVPRQGWEPGLRCTRCSALGRCIHCAGALLRTGRASSPSCGTCGRPAPAWVCPHCDNKELRASAVGQERTAEELGRAFPGLPVTVSGGDHIVLTVADRSGLVISTPGAEPVCAGKGYAAAVLLDGSRLLGRTSMRAGEDALRRWINAAALVRSGGQVLLCAPTEAAPSQALVRWDPVWFARRESSERAELRLPPASRMAIVDGPQGEALALAGTLQAVEVLGPVAHPWRDGEPGERVVLRVPRSEGNALAAQLSVAIRDRSAHRAPPVRVQLDPPDPV